MYDLYPQTYSFSNTDSFRSDDADQLELQSLEPTMANNERLILEDTCWKGI